MLSLVAVCLSSVLMCTTVCGIALAPVYWNASNPTFKPSRNSLIIDVSLYDEIDFVCPFYDTQLNNDSTLFEYYVIYMVSQQAYDSCNLSADNSLTAIINCSNPLQRRRFTMYFEPYTAIPNTPEYHAGSSYYYITTSSGRLDGLHNTVNGACTDHNLKLVISVCCQTDAPTNTSMLQSPTSPQSSTTTTTTQRPSTTTLTQLLLSTVSSKPADCDVNKTQPTSTTLTTSSTTTTTTATTTSQLSTLSTQVSPYNITVHGSSTKTGVLHSQLVTASSQQSSGTQQVLTSSTMTLRTSTLLHKLLLILYLFFRLHVFVILRSLVVTFYVS